MLLSRRLMRFVRLTCVAFALLLTACGSAPTVRVAARPAERAIPAFEPYVAEPQVMAATSLAFRALSLVGTPYHYGGEAPSQGFDCSGFVRYLYRDALGLQLLRTAQAQSAQGRKLRQLTRLRLGDLVFFGDQQTVFHVGLYVGEGRFVHAPRTGKTVQLSSLAQGYWHGKYSHARRVL